LKNNSIEVKTSLIGKAFFVFLFLLGTAFFSGIYIGKETAPNPLDYSIDDKIKEQLNSCSEQVQRLSLKFTSLKSYAIEKGILDKNGNKIKQIKVTSSKNNEENTKKIIEDKDIIKNPKNKIIKSNKNKEKITKKE